MLKFVNRIKDIFNKDTTNMEDIAKEVDDPILRALLLNKTITRDEAMTLPAFSSDVDFISSIIASMPIKLYKRNKGEVSELEGDSRVKLLNNDTGDTLNGYQLKKAIVEDYLLGKGGYAFIKKVRNKVVGIYYVRDIDIQIFKNQDPIYKYFVIQVNGKNYKNYEFIKLLRNTKDGAKGVGVVTQLSKVLETAYQTLLYQLFVVKSGGNKKGFLQSSKKLGKEEIDSLKNAWNKLYRTNEQNIIVLNDGLKFQESSNTSVEMQLNENSKTLATDIHDIFHIKSDFYETFKIAIYPIIKNFQDELNSVLLLENEKEENYFFEFDVKEIVRANLKERYEAYSSAITKGWKTINEVRNEENLNHIEGLDVVNVGLGAVLYDIKTQKYYTPNTNKTNNPSNSKIEDNEGGEKSE